MNYTEDFLRRECNQKYTNFKKIGEGSFGDVYEANMKETN